MHSLGALAQDRGANVLFGGANVVRSNTSKSTVTPEPETDMFCSYCLPLRLVQRFPNGREYLPGAYEGEFGSSVVSDATLSDRSCQRGIQPNEAVVPKLKPLTSGSI